MTQKCVMLTKQNVCENRFTNYVDRNSKQYVLNIYTIMHTSVFCPFEYLLH